MPDRRLIGWLLFIALLAGFGIPGWREYQHLVATKPDLFPWTALRLDRPAGPFTTFKLVQLGNDPRQCQAVLAQAGIRFEATPPVTASQAACGYADGVTLLGEPRFEPARLITACPLAAALWKWKRETLDPAARRRFGAPVARLEHFGSYECRRMGRARTGGWSEHATADAVDVSAFRLTDGRRISVRHGWNGTTAERAFLRESRGGACSLFATTLTPDYNADHFDHFHLDLASRGRLGWNVCR